MFLRNWHNIFHAFVLARKGKYYPINDYNSTPLDEGDTCTECMPLSAVFFKKIIANQLNLM